MRLGYGRRASASRRLLDIDVALGEVLDPEAGRLGAHREQVEVRLDDTLEDDGREEDADDDNVAECVQKKMQSLSLLSVLTIKSKDDTRQERQR